MHIGGGHISFEVLEVLRTAMGLPNNVYLCDIFWKPLLFSSVFRVNYSSRRPNIKIKTRGAKTKHRNEHFDI